MGNDDMKSSCPKADAHSAATRTAGLEHVRSLIAARIIHILDERKLSARDAEKLTGIAYTDFSRVRNVRLDRFSFDRLIAMLRLLDQDVEVTVSFRRPR